MYDPNADVSPFNALPPVIVGIAMVMGAVEIVLQLGASGLVGPPEAVGWRLQAVRDYAFFGPIWEQMWTLGLFPPEHMVRFITYPFIHLSLIHAAFAIVIVLAMGKAVGELFSGTATLAVFMLPSISGALVFTWVTSSEVPLVGGYPGAYGLIGAFTFLLWVRLTAVGSNSMRAFTLIGVLMGIQLVFAVLFGGSPDWVADVTGFATGFLLSFVVSPGGWARVMAKLRQR